MRLAFSAYIWGSILGSLFVSRPVVTATQQRTVLSLGGFGEDGRQSKKKMLKIFVHIGSVFSGNFVYCSWQTGVSAFCLSSFLLRISYRKVKTRPGEDFQGSLSVFLVSSGYQRASFGMRSTDSVYHMGAGGDGMFARIGLYVCSSRHLDNTIYQDHTNAF